MIRIIWFLTQVIIGYPDMTEEQLEAEETAFQEAYELYLWDSTEYEA